MGDQRRPGKRRESYIKYLRDIFKCKPVKEVDDDLFLEAGKRIGIDFGTNATYLKNRRLQMETGTSLERMTKNERKAHPMVTGLFDYFSDALAAVANVSHVGNDQHNPGQSLHWDRSKSIDHGDCLVRHMVARGTIDDDGLRHTAKVAWRALAMLQLEIEGESKPTGHDDTFIQAQYEKPTFYVAGPMRGYDQFNFPAFDAAVNRGEERGYQMVSPANLDRAAGFNPSTDEMTDEQMDEVIRRDIDAILKLDPSKGDGIAVLPGWSKSIGARAEIALARWRGLSIVNSITFGTIDNTLGEI